MISAWLARQKRDGQSFSQVIKTHFGPQPTVERFRERLSSIQVSEPALAGMDRQIRARRLEPARAVRR